MPPTMDQHVGLKLSPNLLQRIDNEVIRRMQEGAKPQGDHGAASRSAVIRDALDDYLARRELAA